MYTANVHVTIYIPAMFQRDLTKNDREIGGRSWWERSKMKSKKEKTLQQQEGLPTMSVDLNKKMSRKKCLNMTKRKERCRSSKFRIKSNLRNCDVFKSNKST